MACPICNNIGKHHSVSVKDYEYNIKNVTEYFFCYSCEAIYRNKFLSKKEEEKLYDKGTYKPVKGGIIYDYLKKINAHYEKNIILKLLSKRKIQNTSKILDIACGKGYLLEQFTKNKNFQCFGIDINATIENNKIKFFKSSYANIDIIKNINPNLIIINNFIEHMEDYTILHKILNIMEYNSTMVIITPDANSNARRYFKDCWSGFHAPRHKIIFNKNNILKIFKKKNNNYFEIDKLYDPFTNLVSLNNLLKKLKNEFSLINLFKVMISPLMLFLDIINKNRVIILIKKNK